MNFEALIIANFPASIFKSVKFTNEPIDWIPEANTARRRCLNKLKPNVCKDVDVHDVKVTHQKDSS